MESYTYGLLLAVSVLVPLIRSFEHRVQYARKWKYLFPALFITAAVFIGWDILFEHNNIWGFNGQYTGPVYILGLPLEEWLFFIVIPFCCIFIYEVLKYFIKRFHFPKLSLYFSLLLGIFLVMVAVLNYQRAYTFVAFLFAAFWLFLQPVFKSHKTYLSFFYLMYFISLIPFLIINGVLTSLPVVTYNDAENLSIRLFTIPIEDSIYLLGLLLMNMNLYEGFKASRPYKHKT